MRGLTWLASYPKSGNTWVRCLVGAYLTGSCHPNHLPWSVMQSDLRGYDYQVVSPWDLKQLDPVQVIALRQAVLEHLRLKRWGLTKTHHARMSVRDLSLIPDRVTAKAVYIVRDPRDIAPSFAAHINADLDSTIWLMRQRQAVLNCGEIPTMAHCLSSWSLHVDSWMKAEFPALCVKYETIRDKPEDQLGQILDFLGFEVDLERVELAVQEASMDKVRAIEDDEGFAEAKNATFFGGERPVLSDEQRRQVEADHGEVMSALGYL